MLLQLKMNVPELERTGNNILLRWKTGIVLFGVSWIALTAQCRDVNSEKIGFQLTGYCNLCNTRPGLTELIAFSRFVFV